MPSPLELIDTIVVLILENRSFDHMLGYLNLPGPSRIPLEGLRSDADWLRQHANSGIEPFELDNQVVEDPPHEMATIAIQLGVPPAPGAVCPMDGFVESYRRRHPPPAQDRLVMGYYTARTVPVFDFLARHYSVCDHWFASLPTGTQANRLMAMSGATSLTDNAPLFLPDQPLVYDWLSDHGVTWCAYQSGSYLPYFTLMRRWQDEIATSLALDALVSHAHPRFRRFSNFARDWQTEQSMPAVIFIEPEYTDGPHGVPNDDHPPTGVTEGQAFLAEVYNALIANPTRWARTVPLVTYDEHSGFFDHIPPLDIPTPLLGHGALPVFATTGVRVSAFVISPLVDPGTVFPQPLDHTSILQLIADKFGRGLYSSAVTSRQSALARLSAAFTREAPRSDAPPALGAASAPVVVTTGSQPAPGASANAAAFRLAAARITADHSGIAVGWPELATAFAKR